MIAKVGVSESVSRLLADDLVGTLFLPESPSSGESHVIPRKHLAASAVITAGYSGEAAFRNRNVWTAVN